MIECPFCEVQGIICKAEVKKLARTIYICDECDTIWLDGDEIKEETCLRFDEFMNQYGLQPLWSELDHIEKVWRK
jgi:Zn-finger nucleic acid-binding protein